MRIALLLLSLAACETHPRDSDTDPFVDTDTGVPDDTDPAVDTGDDTPAWPDSGSDTDPGSDTDTGGDTDTGYADTDVVGCDTDDTAYVFDSDDQDCDGWSADEDCDDLDPRTFPGARERCDGRDNDCSGAPAFGETDSVGDGLLDCERCDAAGFWDAVKHLDDPAAIRAALRDVQGTLTCDYSDARDYMFLTLDKVDGFVECVYTGKQVAVGDERPDHTIMNTEHAWPQSQGADVPPPRCDIHHLYPSDSDANSKRGNTAFGPVVSGVTWEVGGSRLGKDAGGQTVFEPRDVSKGDIARSMLYFAYRYEKAIPDARLAVYRAWHAEHPADDAEWLRTVGIGAHQGSANPFVACPDLALRGW